MAPGWGWCGDPLMDPHPQPLPTRGRGTHRVRGAEALHKHALLRRRNLARALRHHQAISDPKLGQEYPRLGRVDLDLLPELAHEDTQIMRVVQMGRPPDLLEQELVGDDVAGMLRQQL